jgi:copper chaperone CopZ
MNRTVVAVLFGVSLLTGGVLLANSNLLAPASPQIAAATTASSSAAPAQENISTAKLKVDGMWCSGCAYVVKQALMRTPGVHSATVSMLTRTATVTYDPTQTEVEALVAATTNYGYASAVLR